MKIVLADFSVIQYESDNGLNFICPRNTLEECNADEAKLTADNLRNVTLTTDEGGVLAELHDLVLSGTEEIPVYGADEETVNGYELHIHLREKTDVELLTERVAVLEDSQSTQDEAIDDLGEAVSNLYEEV